MPKRRSVVILGVDSHKRHRKRDEKKMLMRSVGIEVEWSDKDMIEGYTKEHKEEGLEERRRPTIVALESVVVLLSRVLNKSAIVIPKASYIQSACLEAILNNNKSLSVSTLRSS